MSVSEQTLLDLKAKLKAQQELGLRVPTDLYAHLTEVFNRISLHHASGAFEEFE